MLLLGSDCVAEALDLVATLIEPTRAAQRQSLACRENRFRGHELDFLDPRLLVFVFHLNPPLLPVISLLNGFFLRSSPVTQNTNRPHRKLLTDLRFVVKRFICPLDQQSLLCQTLWRGHGRWRKGIRWVLPGPRCRDGPGRRIDRTD